MYKLECNHKRLARVHHKRIVMYHVEDKPSKSKRDMRDLEIDAFDLMEGKMSDIAMERLHKQICSKTI